MANASTLKTTMTASSRIARAEEYPRLSWSIAASKMKKVIVVVSKPGPPLVSWKIASKTWSEVMMARTVVISSNGRIAGSVM